MSRALEKFSLNGRTAVVTGGSRGLGYNMARILAAAGAKVLISARTVSDLKRTAEKLAEEENGDVIYTTVDLTDRDSVKQFADEAERLLGKVDIFVANAAMEGGTTLVDAVDEKVEAVIDRLLEANLVANLILTSRFAEGMKKRGWGRVIYISSCGTRVAGDYGHGIYSTTKAGLDVYTQSASVELGPYGITANCVLPGAYMTDMLKERLDALPPEESKARSESLTSMTSLLRFGDPEELEGIILLLASDAGSYISGAQISVDGGYTIKMMPNTQVHNTGATST